jgi:hypothetical protein
MNSIGTGAHTLSITGANWAEKESIAQNTRTIMLIAPKIAKNPTITFAVFISYFPLFFQIFFDFLLPNGNE